MLRYLCSSISFECILATSLEDALWLQCVTLGTKGIGGSNLKLESRCDHVWVCGSMADSLNAPTLREKWLTIF